MCNKTTRYIIYTRFRDFINSVQRNSIAKELPLQTLKRYVALIKNKNRKAIVHEVNKSCGGCGFSLRPQLLIELVKGKMHSCESCGRMIVSSTFFKTEE